MAAQAKVKEDLPPRKSLRLQGVDADTGVKLPEKEPSRYFQYESYEENVKHPLRDLELHEILSRKDKEEDINTISSYLAGVVDNLEKKKATKSDKNVQYKYEFDENVSALTKRLKIKVSLCKDSILSKKYIRRIIKQYQKNTMLTLKTSFPGRASSKSCTQ